MELKSLHCPNCNATLDVEDGLDTFFCKYCGHKILLDGQSEAAYKAKVNVKRMEHEERLQDKRDAHERFKIEAEQKDQRKTLLIVMSIFGSIIVLCMIVSFFGNAGAKRQERELQATVDQIMIDIENGDFAEAYVKANTLYWDDSWTSEGEEKWDATRKEIIKQIKAAEKEASRATSDSDDSDDSSGGFWDWFK